MVVLQDRTADGTEGVVAVGQHIRHRKLRESGCACRLQDIDIVVVWGDHAVKLQLKMLHVATVIVGRQDTIGHGFLTTSLDRLGRCRTGVGNIARRIEDDAVIK